MKPGTPLLQSIHSLDQMHERIGCMHYSHCHRTICLYQVRFMDVGVLGVAKGNGPKACSLLALGFPPLRAYIVLKFMGQIDCWRRY
jgi:hypothetical protein